MPATAPLLIDPARNALRALGEQLRTQRKTLRISAVATAGAAGLSRVTLHRIERGEPSVTIGAYFNVAAALGMGISVAVLTPVQTAGILDAKSI